MLVYQVSAVDLNTSPKITPNTFFCSNKCLKCYQIQKRSIFNLRGSTPEACYFYYHNFIQFTQINFVGVQREGRGVGVVGWGRAKILQSILH